MIEVGKYHTLEVIKHLDFGIILKHDDEEILLPTKSLPKDEKLWDIGQFLEVFVYLDSEDRPIATTEIPAGTVGDSVLLTVVGQSDFGTFMDWGLTKDLLVPFKEQNKPTNMGRSYVVHIFLDKSDRIAGSTKLSNYLDEFNDGKFEFREEVDLLIAGRSDLGYKAVINNSHLGLIHQNEVVRPLKSGDRFKGYIGELREDGRINLTLQKLAYEVREELSDVILKYMQDHGSIIGLTDKSPPGEINAIFHVSKSNYKKALGKLFKEGKITFHEKSVRLIQE
ncbi:MAG: S1-like domain-containing RNA-binding protein [Emcibacteraceae bacterium]|nr:S1-like domain-containing RNA-binding protein [Emcibacteraceae bacterium]MDG1727061.1 S1-like domain-containing RNA-binding protein [Emcibacteraceae bacterium]